MQDELQVQRNLRNLVYDWTSDSATKALFKASKIGREDIIKSLMADTGADINAKDQWDRLGFIILLSDLFRLIYFNA